MGSDMGEETGIDGKPDEDYQGLEGEISIGRVYPVLQTLKAGKRFWAIQYPKGAKAWLPEAAGRLDKLDKQLTALEGEMRTLDTQELRLSAVEKQTSDAAVSMRSLEGH